MFQTFISRHNSNFFSDKLVLTFVTPASSAHVFQSSEATAWTFYFDCCAVNSANGGFLDCLEKDTCVNRGNRALAVGAEVALEKGSKNSAWLVNNRRKSP